jgi:hypothetical protein
MNDPKNSEDEKASNNDELPSQQNQTTAEDEFHSQLPDAKARCETGF